MTHGLHGPVLEDASARCLDTGPELLIATAASVRARLRECSATATCTVRASGRARTLGSEGTNEELIMGKGIHPTSKLNESRGFQCLGHSH